MKHTLFFLSVFGFPLLLLSSCQNPAEVEESHADEIFSLIERYVTDKSILFFGSGDPKSLEGASITGRTSKNITYAQFTGEEATPFLMLDLISSKRQVPDECFLEADPNIFEIRGYAGCVDELLDAGHCLYTHRDSGGNTISRVTECLE